MGIFDWFSSQPGVKEANSIPPPRSDALVNAPLPEYHRRVADFVREAPNARSVDLISVERIPLL